jgi:hypothetical protein
MVASLALAGFSTWVLVIHFMPLSENRIIRAIQSDWHYCCLVPLTLPVAAFVAALDWFLLKLFRHNE